MGGRGSVVRRRPAPAPRSHRFERRDSTAGQARGRACATAGGQTRPVDIVLQWVLPVVGGVLLLWVALVAALWLAKPDERSVREALRLLPDVVRLIRRLAVDREVPRGVRVRLWLLLGYLALPIDLVPDVLPVIGYADDAVVVALVLRSVARRAGVGTLARNWPGTADGLAAVCRLARLPAPTSA
ncbi:DUF1232 domain-containing protein [Cellulomonas hominis]|nr:DUF1232 domain-containing protein [Cellulomonas hominis]